MRFQTRFQRVKKTISKYLPRQCPLCGLELYPDDGHWCKCCLQWFYAKPRCQRCGEPMLSSVIQCGQCLANPPLWQRLWCLGDYDFPLSPYIHKIKHRRQFWLLPPLCELLAQTIDEPASLLIPVPLHWQRYLFRGFNQSTLITQHLSHQLNIPYKTDMIKRNYATKPQQGQNRESRLKNLNRAFSLRYAPQHPHIAIVDDVVTTGTTVSQIGQLLLDAGVKRVDIYCLCRTPESWGQI